jgi:hypothetical protein
LSLITEVGTPRNASIRSGAGFGTLVMAVVMLIKIVSPAAPARRHMALVWRPHDGFGCSKTISIPLEQV